MPRLYKRTQDLDQLTNNNELLGYLINLPSIFEVSQHKRHREIGVLITLFDEKEITQGSIT
jgi:hypothetical protein